jgi:hypothetical protein
LHGQDDEEAEEFSDDGDYDGDDDNSWKVRRSDPRSAHALLAFTLGAI